MKKAYIKPEMLKELMEPESMIAVSTFDNPADKDKEVLSREFDGLFDSDEDILNN